MRYFVAIALTLLTAFRVAKGAEYCAVRLRIVDPQGRPLDSTFSVFDERGKLVLESKSAQGVAEICDLPFGNSRIDIGRETSCGSLTIKNLRDRWPLNQEIVAVRNLCGGDQIGPQLGCMVAFRIKDMVGHPLAGVTIDVGGSRIPVSDRFGRAWAAISTGSMPIAELSIFGYEPLSSTLNCKMDSLNIRKEVTMRRIQVR